MKHIALLAMLAASTISCKDDVTPAPAETTIEYHQTAATQFIETGGTKYAYRVLGTQSDTPLILLSSLGSSMDDWDPAITNGLAQKHKVIIFDNKGVGSSTGKTPNSIADMAKDAVSFIKAMGYSKVNLAGFSMGSFIIQQIALTEPTLVNKIILTGTGPKGSEGLINLPSLLAATANLSAEDAFLYFGFTKSTKSKNAGKLSYQRIQKRNINRDLSLSSESGTAQLEAVLAWAQPYPNALNELKTITQPTLIVQGQNDIPVPAVNAVNMSQNIPKANLVIYPDAGHAAIFQNPDLFVQQASGFIDK